MQATDSGQSRTSGGEKRAFDPGTSTPDEEDRIFGILRNRRRRCVLRYLRANGGTAEFRELVERLAAWETDQPVHEVTYKQRKRVYISLHQTHLPKLKEAGIVAHDRDDDLVALTDEFEACEPYLDPRIARTNGAGGSPREDPPEEDRRAGGSADRPTGFSEWGVAYVGAGISGIVATLLTVLGVVPFAAVPTSAYAVAMGVVAVVAGAHHRATAGRAA